MQDVLVLIQDLQKSPNLRKLDVEILKDSWLAEPTEQRKYGEICKGIWRRIVLCLEQLTWIGQIKVQTLYGRTFFRWHSSSQMHLQQGNYFSELPSVYCKGAPVIHLRPLNRKQETTSTVKIYVPAMEFPVGLQEPLQFNLECHYSVSLTSHQQNHTRDTVFELC